MEVLISVIVYGLIIWSIISALKKKRGAAETGMQQQNMPTKKYDTYNKKSLFRESGSMPHKHETKKYTSSMADASKLPPGYILLNGEPVRVADLEGK